MGKVLIPGGGGGGAISDDITLRQSDVPVGLTAVTFDSDDEIVEGTLTTTASPDKVLKDETFYNTETHQKESGSMVNNGAVSQSLNCGGSYTIPAGYHNGSGTVTANSLASQTSATAAAADILTGKTAYVSGSKITGTMATMAGGTYTPSTSEQTISCSGKKMTSNIVIPAFSLPSASVILAGKTVTIYGKSVTGTAQQYLQNATNFEIVNESKTTITGYYISNGSYIELDPYTVIRFNTARNLTNYKYLKCEGSKYVAVGVSKNPNNTGVTWASPAATSILDIGSLSDMYFIYIKNTSDTKYWAKRITFSNS